MNDTFFKSVHITNFKSLKDVTLSDCKRINLLIGKPNVGKSNILEAIGLFSLPYFSFNNNKKLSQFIRLENLSELFFDGNKENSICIETNTEYFCSVEYIKASRSAHVKLAFNDNTKGKSSSDKISIHNSLSMDFDSIFPFADSEYKVKYYKFIHDFSTEKKEYKEVDYSFHLIPPTGVNLIEAIQENIELKKELVYLFSGYNLKLLFDKGSNSLRIMKETKDGEVFSMPYSSIADTLQRVVFFKTAIASNKDSIILFEEPEAHCFPPYIAHFTQDVINSTSNQFFVATHSPYVLNDFLETEETRKELAIFIADFKDGQTVINRLTDDEVNEVYDYGIDVFFNYERFTRHDG